MNQNTKRLVLLNLPYALLGLYATNLGRAWRMAAGADMSEKMQSLMTEPFPQKRTQNRRKKLNKNTEIG